MNCPRCASAEHTKNGIVNGLQRYKCKQCAYNFTVEQKSSLIDAGKKRLAVILYLEGLRITSISELLKVSHVSVLNWVRRYCHHAEELRSKEAIPLEQELSILRTLTKSKRREPGAGTDS